MTKVNWRDNIINKKWGTLSQFKEYVETNKLEKIVSFNGARLETDTGYYGLYDSQLSYEANPEEPKPKKPIRQRKIQQPAVKSPNAKKIKEAVKKVVAKQPKKKDKK